MPVCNVTQASRACPSVNHIPSIGCEKPGHCQWGHPRNKGSHATPPASPTGVARASSDNNGWAAYYWGNNAPTCGCVVRRGLRIPPDVGGGLFQFP